MATKAKANVSRKAKNKGLLRRAPAQEIIYSIRTINPVPVDLERIRGPLKEALSRTFSIAEDFTAFQTTVQHPVSEEPVVNTEKRPMGFRFRKAKGGHVAHFMPDGLVVNWLNADYKGYPESIKTLKRYWKLYNTHFQPIGVDHLSLRYINQLLLPLDEQGGLDLQLYIQNNPKAPAIEGLSFTGFQHFSELHKMPEGIRTRVMLATLNMQEKHVPMLFDYEAFLSMADQERNSEPHLWKTFDRLHTWCGRFFKKTLTDRCHTLFK